MKVRGIPRPCDRRTFQNPVAEPEVAVEGPVAASNAGSGAERRSEVDALREHLEHGDDVGVTMSGDQDDAGPRSHRAVA
jgi:hypothetical protein